MMQCKAISFSTLTLASVHRLCLKWEGSERSGQPGQWHRDRLHGVAKEREGAASTETHERPRSERCLLHTVFHIALYASVLSPWCNLSGALFSFIKGWLNGISTVTSEMHFSIFLQACKACEKESSRKAKVSHTARFTASFEGLFFTEQAPYGCLKSLNTRILLWWRFEKWLFFCVKCLKQLKTVPTWLLDTLWNMKLLYDSCLSFYLFKQSTKMSMHVMYTSSWS